MTLSSSYLLLRHCLTVPLFIYQAANNIKVLEGLTKLSNLVFLHLRENNIEILDGFTDELVNLQYINLRLSPIHCLYFWIVHDYLSYLIIFVAMSFDMKS